MNLKDWRLNYDKYSLDESSMPSDPFQLFQLWFDQAVVDLNPEPNAMSIATCENNMPSTRIVLLKEIENENFVFYTNYSSRKGQDITANPSVALLFYWAMSQRQVRIYGQASKLSREKAEAYFKTRPIESQVSAIASPQSSQISKIELIERANEVAASDKLLCPENWGGISVEPSEIEFWQGQPGRLHDRVVYKKTSSTLWEMHRLAP
jgi:pyridoxamine 5'-phosphate oxidase